MEIPIQVSLNKGKADHHLFCPVSRSEVDVTDILDIGANRSIHKVKQMKP
jgi:hypothetical protein